VVVVENRPPHLDLCGERRLSSLGPPEVPSVQPNEPVLETDSELEQRAALLRRERVVEVADLRLMIAATGFSAVLSDPGFGWAVQEDAQRPELARVGPQEELE
jgi:hypothetical protein